MDRLVIFTAHYPYGNGEPFLEDELRIAESYFQEILIVSYAKQSEVFTRYVPDNARVIHLRRDSGRRSKLNEAFLVFKSFFMTKAYREIFVGIKERGFKRLPYIIKTLLLYARHIGYIHHVKENRTNDSTNQTIFYSYWLNAAAAFLAQNRKKLNGICICRAHGGDCFFDRAYVPWRKDVIERLDKVFSISDGGKTDLTFHYKKYIRNIDDKIAVARLGVNISESLNDTHFDKQRIIVSCSNVIPLKRLDLLIGALADQNIKHHIKWVHFGDGPLFEEISHLAMKRLGDAPNVTYEFKGRTTKEEIFRFYRETRVALFINCSDVEGIPVSIMEAMSYGIPAIARDVGCNRELVNDTCGALLPAKITPEDLAISINHILDESEDSTNRMRKAAMEIVRNDYDCKRNYTLFFYKLESMIREKVNE